MDPLGIDSLVNFSIVSANPSHLTYDRHPQNPQETSQECEGGGWSLILENAINLKYTKSLYQPTSQALNKHMQM